jgi:hypothetical protein
MPAGDAPTVFSHAQGAASVMLSLRAASLWHASALHELGVQLIVFVGFIVACISDVLLFYFTAVAALLSC